MYMSSWCPRTTTRSVRSLCIQSRHCSVPSFCRTSPPSRPYASNATPHDSNPSNEVKNVAILGGGITGLTAAFYLSKFLPEVRITLFEGSSRLGGWLHSAQVDVGNGHVVFEQGPRTLRPNVPNGLVTLKLIKDLGLEQQLIYTSKNSVAAQNRYVYYPDHLVRMPGPGMTLFENLFNIWKEPAFDGLLDAMAEDLSTEKRPDSLEDESVGAFFARRANSKIADNLVSAVLHGIYAGDVYKLSMRSIMPWLWNLEKEHGSVLSGFWDEGSYTSLTEHDWTMLQSLEEFPEKESPAKEIIQAVERSSVFTFKKGLGELSDRLEAHLSQNPMIDIQRRTLVTEIRLDKETSGEKIHITTKGSAETSDSKVYNNQFTHVISTISGKTLSSIARGEEGQQVLSQFQETPSVTVMVVNLYFSNPDILPVHGFGYLIPRSVPYTENPERALGVVFDSDATIGQDGAGGTKVTVMLGGHWWDEWDSYPDEDEGARMAKAILTRHLGISVEPDAIRVSLQKDCIPQYTVGHHSRLSNGSGQLEQHFEGRLRVAGNSYTGVGLNDCVRAAREVVKELVDGVQGSGLSWHLNNKVKVRLNALNVKNKTWRSVKDDGT